MKAKLVLWLLGAVLVPSVARAEVWLSAGDFGPRDPVENVRTDRGIRLGVNLNYTVRAVIPYPPELVSAAGAKVTVYLISASSPAANLNCTLRAYDAGNFYDDANNSQLVQIVANLTGDNRTVRAGEFTFNALPVPKTLLGIEIGGPGLGGTNIYVHSVKIEAVPSNSSLEGEGSRSDTWIEVVPNPSARAIQVRFDVARTGSVELDVCDVQGRSVGSIPSREYSAGAHVLDWDAAGLPAGSYFVRLTDAERTGIRRFVLLE